jgi:hypothetical protein
VAVLTASLSRHGIEESAADSYRAWACFGTTFATVKMRAVEAAVEAAAAAAAAAVVVVVVATRVALLVEGRTQEAGKDCAGGKKEADDAVRERRTDRLAG